MNTEPVRKPAGGYILIRAHDLLSVWEAHRAKIIELGDLSVWLACHELVARRTAAHKCPRSRYTVEEVARLVGGRSEQTVHAAVRRLERVGLLQWSAEQIRFRLQVNADVAMGSMSNRLVPVPRRVVRFLGRGAPRSVVATMLGLLLRCVFYRDGLCTRVGTCKTNWLAQTFGIDERSAKRARAYLTELGWLETLDTPQWRLNRWGGVFVVNLDWNDRGTPPPRLTPPQAASTAHLSPPESHKQPLRVYNDQKPPPGREPGLQERSTPAPAPSLRNIQTEDLRRRGRLLALHAQACGLGLAEPGEAGTLRFASLAARARRVATRNAGGMLAWLLRERCWNFITLEDEDRARRWLAGQNREQTSGRITPAMRAPTPVAAVMRSVLSEHLTLARAA